MPTLLLELAAPLQSWGASSRHNHRGTRHFPTHSGITGMISAALGRTREDSPLDLPQFQLGVRADQPGVLISDFQTEITEKGKALPLTYRDYLADALFLCAISAEKSTLDTIANALSKPAYPLSLGRRSCPPEGQLVLGIEDIDLDAALRTTPWRARPWHQRRTLSAEVTVAYERDALPGEAADETIRDRIVSLDPANRSHALRPIVTRKVTLANPLAAPQTDAHDPFSLL